VAREERFYFPMPASGRPTERYLGSEQDLAVAVNDTFGL
jgi:hypothetical protein